jgi:hypothetical protein
MYFILLFNMNGLNIKGVWRKVRGHIKEIRYKLLPLGEQDSGLCISHGRNQTYLQDLRKSTS